MSGNIGSPSILTVFEEISQGKSLISTFARQLMLLVALSVARSRPKAVPVLFPNYT